MERSMRYLWEMVDRYIETNLQPADAHLTGALAANQAANLPEIDVSPSHGKMLWTYAKLANAKHIFEFGLLGGYSTIWMARALPAGGKVTSFELNAEHAAVAQKNLANAGLDDKVDIHVGAALDSLAKIDSQGGFKDTIDMIFIDADKQNNAPYLDWCMEYVRPGTLIVCDNMVRGGRVVDPLHPDAAIQGCRTFVDYVRDNKRLEGFGLQTVGQKGYDGFVIAIVTE